MLLIAICVQVSFVVQGQVASASTDLSKVYEEIDAILCTKIENNDDFQANLEELKTLKGTKGEKFDLAIKQIEQLSELDFFCDSNELGLLTGNHEAIQGRARSLRGFNSHSATRRLDKIIRQVLVEHAQRCQFVYPENLDSDLRLIEAKFGPSFFDKLHRLLHKIVENFALRKAAGATLTSTKYTTLEDYLNKTENVKYLLDYVGSTLYIEDTWHLYDVLLEFSADDQDAKYLRPTRDPKTGVVTIQKFKVRELIDRYLCEPCRQFSKELGPEIMEPAKFDLQTLERSFRPAEEPDDQLAKFNLMFAYYQVCGRITRSASTDLVTVMTKVIAGQQVPGEQ